MATLGDGAQRLLELAEVFMNGGRPEHRPDRCKERMDHRAFRDKLHYDMSDDQEHMFHLSHGSTNGPRRRRTA